MSKRRVLVVDDEPYILKAIDRLLSRAGYEVVLFACAAQALEAAAVSEFDVVVSDYRMPEVNGVDFLAAFQSLRPQTPRIMLTGQADRAAMVKSINKAAVYRFLEKPFDSAELLEIVAGAVDQHQENARVCLAMDRLQTEISAEYREKKTIENLEREMPGITQVNWSENNTIVIEDC